MPDLSIVIPAYDEPENIRRLLPWIDQTLSDISHETIVVVPSESDSTAAEVRVPTARVVVQEGPGYGGALR